MSTTSSTLAPAPESILRHLEWRVIRRLDGLFQGDYRTLFYGTGVDFADLREYQPGDDIRHIDWNVTARMNSPHVRQYVEDREITAWFLLDLTRSMTFGPAERPKESVLIDYVATLARLLTRDGNRVGAILYNNGVEGTIPPRTGRNQVLRLMRELLRAADGTPQAAPGTTTSLSTLLNAGLNTFKRRSVVFVISDFISDPGWDRPLSLLYRRHELISVRLWDPREVELPDAGLLVVEDVETGEHLYVDTSDAGFRRRFAAAAQQRMEMLSAGIKKSGVDLYSISTEEDITSAIVRMATLRKRRRR
jgi:uncharacterized protein (DUF58 family)